MLCPIFDCKENGNVLNFITAVFFNMSAMRKQILHILLEVISFVIQFGGMRCSRKRCLKLLYLSDFLEISN